jgi:hypothetical protein
MPTHIPIRDDDAAIEHHPVDDIEPEPEPMCYGDMGQALIVIIAWMLEAHSARTIGGRALLLARLLGVEHKHNANYSRIAEAANVSRESIRQAAAGLEAFAGLRSRAIVTDPKRSNCSERPLNNAKARRYSGELKTTCGGCEEAPRGKESF